MDPVLFDKLPSGGALWNIRHERSKDWVQQFYEAPEKPSECVSPVVTAPHTSPDRKQKLNIERVSGRPNGTPVLGKILDVLDPCSTLYTPDQHRDAVDAVRMRLLAFVTGLAHPYFGPKKSRMLSKWLSNNKCDPEYQSVIQEFCAFLLEDKAQTWVIESAPRGDWYVKN